MRNLLKFVIAVTLACAPLGPHGRTHAAPMIWSDHATGFALGGYDPVAYFTQRRPKLGHEGIEYRWGGAAWRFLNASNRAAFARHPGVYTPVFAGYDALALSKGLTVQGYPTIWAVYKERVYLFSDIASLRAWRRNPEKITSVARSNWTRLGKDLPGTSGW